MLSLYKNLCNYSQNFIALTIEKTENLHKRVKTETIRKNFVKCSQDSKLGAMLGSSASFSVLFVSGSDSSFSPSLTPLSKSSSKFLHFEGFFQHRSFDQFWYNSTHFSLNVLLFVTLLFMSLAQSHTCLISVTSQQNYL